MLSLEGGKMSEFVTLKMIDEAVAAIKSITKKKPKIGLILGSGLGDLAESVSPADYIHYRDIPNWPQSTIQGHKGRLVIGDLGDQSVLIMQGRAHYYEGYPMVMVGFPIRVMIRLGVEVLIVTNAAGAVNPDYEPGEVMLIKDHISLIAMAGLNPLRGPNIDEFGERFPDMSQPYDLKLIEAAKEAAKENGIFIPTFCNDERLKPEASCRVCVVEIEGQNKLQTSCNLQVQEGLKIFTNSEKATKARDEVIELMWASHPNDCVVCDANEDCKLQDYMYLYDIDSNNLYDGFSRTYEKDESNKFFYIDPEKCILCGKCVRVCSELQGVEALGFNERGHKAFISFAYDLGMDYSTCVSCGNCVSVCPTGALMEKSRNKFRMHETKKTLTTCIYCGVGCQFNIVTKDNKIIPITNLISSKSISFITSKIIIADAEILSIPSLSFP